MPVCTERTHPAKRCHMTITRGEKQVYVGEVPVSQMKRSLTELAGWLYRETDFVNGCFLMT